MLVQCDRPGYTVYCNKLLQRQQVIATRGGKNAFIYASIRDTKIDALSDCVDAVDLGLENLQRGVVQARLSSEWCWRIYGMVTRPKFQSYV